MLLFLPASIGATDDQIVSLVYTITIPNDQNQ
jgi:hypothetical protein